MSLEMSLLLILSLMFLEQDPPMQVLTDCRSINDNFTLNKSCACKNQGVNELFSTTNTIFLFLFHGVRTSILGFASSSC